MNIVQKTQKSEQTFDLDREILKTLLISRQQSIQSLTERLKEAYPRDPGKSKVAYPNVRRHVADKGGLIEEGYITSQQARTKSGSLDRRRTRRLELSYKGLARLIINGELNDQKFVSDMDKALRKRRPSFAAMWPLIRDLSGVIGEDLSWFLTQFVPQDVLIGLLRAGSESHYSAEKITETVTFTRLLRIARKSRKIVEVIRKHPRLEKDLRNILETAFTSLRFGTQGLLAVALRYSISIGSKVLLVTEESNYNRLDELARAEEMSVEDYLDKVVVCQHLKRRRIEWYARKEGISF